MKRTSFIFTGILALAGIIYNSWPLGYLLDSNTARYGVASDLEDPSHPYAWVFIAGDVVVALILIGVALYIYKNKPSLRLKYLWSSLCLGLFIFGFFTGFGAAAPDKCYSLGDTCFSIFSRNVSIDGLETSIAAFGLLIALLSSALLARALGILYSFWSWLTFVVWFGLGLLFLHLKLTGQNVHLAQEIFLILCAVALVSIGRNIDRSYKDS